MFLLPLPTLPREQIELLRDRRSCCSSHGSLQELCFLRAFSTSRFFLAGRCRTHSERRRIPSPHFPRNAKLFPPRSRARSALFSVHSGRCRAERAALCSVEQSADSALWRVATSRRSSARLSPRPLPQLDQPLEQHVDL